MEQVDAEEHEALGPFRERLIHLLRHATLVATVIGTIRLAPFFLE